MWPGELECKVIVNDISIASRCDVYVALGVGMQSTVNETAVTGENTKKTTTQLGGNRS